MRDDRHRWPADQGMGRAVLQARDLTAKVERPLLQTMISGDFDSAMALVGLAGPAVGSGDIATGEAYAIRQRRDRILVVGGPALDEGWHDVSGLAVSDMSCAYAVISLQGPDAQTLLQTGTEYTLTSASPSAARLWHGFTCLVYRYDHEENFRLHVRSAHLEALWDMMVRQVALIGELDRSVLP